MNAFASYGQQAAPYQPKQKPTGELEKRMQEKQCLTKKYRQWKRRANQETLASEPRLVGFMRYLKTVQVEHADELIDAVANSWLVHASVNVRIFALRMIDARCNKLNREMGYEALDDPIDGASVYFRARSLLYVGGR